MTYHTAPPPPAQPQVKGMAVIGWANTNRVILFARLFRWKDKCLNGFRGYWVLLMQILSQHRGINMHQLNNHNKNTHVSRGAPDSTPLQTYVWPCVAGSCRDTCACVCSCVCKSQNCCKIHPTIKCERDCQVSVKEEESPLFPACAVAWQCFSQVSSILQFKKLKVCVFGYKNVTE